VALAFVGQAHAASCTAADAAKRAVVLVQYQHAMVAQRTARIRASQNKTLAELIGAASCELPPAPRGFSLIAARGIAAADIATVRAALATVPAYYERLGVRAFGTTVYVYGSRAATEHGYRAILGVSEHDTKHLWSTATAAGSLDGIFVNAGSDGWKERSVAQRERVVAHELFHAAQNALAEAGWDAATEVPWLAEGAAEYFGTAAVVDAGLMTFASHDTDVAFTAVNAPLSAYQSSNSYSRPGLYAIGYLAVQKLVRMHGPSSVISFYRDLASGVVSWRDAFDMAFGETVDAFYAEFGR
jgi:hypothetical protein